MAATIDWSFFGLDDPFAVMENACSFTPSTDLLPAALGFDSVGVLPEHTKKYTSIPSCQMDSPFDRPVGTTNEACTPFGEAGNEGSTLTPPMTPPYDFLSMLADSATESIDLNDVLARDISPTSLLYADGVNLTTHSPASMKRSYSSRSSSSSYSSIGDHHQEDLPAAKHCRRRPGRPRLDHTSTSSSILSKSQPRVPHNEVERKYREGLNAQLERLRQAVPSLCQGGDEERGRLSKAAVLVGAIAYIRKIEQERDGLTRQVELARRAYGFRERETMTMT